MSKIITAYNNFARAKVDHDMMGRFDLPIYRSAADVMENFETNFKGNAMFRAGFEDMVGAFEDCVFWEFLFNNEQNYIMVFFENTIRFLTYASDGTFGWVESSPSVILEVTTTYTLEQCRELQFTQKNDVVVITHQSHNPKDLTRVSASSFTIANHPLTPSDPFGSGEFPKCCLFYKSRLYFANTPSKPTTVWGSELGDFNIFTIASPNTDISPLEFASNEITQPIDWLFGGENSLILGCAEGLVAVNGGGVGVVIRAETIEADLTSVDGSNSQIPITKDSRIFYEGKNSRNVYYFSYDLLTESFNAKDANFVSYDITKTDLNKIKAKKDRNDLIYSYRGDGKLVSLNFKEEENIIGWHSHSTQGLFKDISVISDNDGNPQLFALVDRGGTFYIERQAEKVEFTERSSFFSGKTKENKASDDEAYNRKVAEELKQCIYLDNSLILSDLKESNLITFDEGAGTITDTDGVFVLGDVGKHISYKTDTGYESGRFEITGYTSANVVEVDVLQEPTATTYSNWYLSFSQISGLTQYIGTTIGVVTDGGFLDEFEITGDTLDLESQANHVVVGYTYRGVIKSFSLGFQISGENTQTTMKSITRTGIRCVSSAGGKFGASPYRMEPIQELSQDDLNYLPPLPIDGTAYVTYTDENERDKYFYVVQDEPLPLTITSVFVDANYSNSR